MQTFLYLLGWFFLFLGGLCFGMLIIVFLTRSDGLLYYLIGMIAFSVIGSILKKNRKPDW